MNSPFSETFSCSVERTCRSAVKILYFHLLRARIHRTLNLERIKKSSDILTGSGCLMEETLFKYYHFMRHFVDYITVFNTNKAKRTLIVLR